LGQLGLGDYYYYYYYYYCGAVIRPRRSSSSIAAQKHHTHIEHTRFHKVKKTEKRTRHRTR